MSFRELQCRRSVVNQRRAAAATRPRRHGSGSVHSATGRDVWKGRVLRVDPLYRGYGFSRRQRRGACAGSGRGRGRRARRSLRAAALRRRRRPHRPARAASGLSRALVHARPAPRAAPHVPQVPARCPTSPPRLRPTSSRYVTARAGLQPAPGRRASSLLTHTSTSLWLSQLDQQD